MKPVCDVFPYFFFSEVSTPIFTRFTSYFAREVFAI
ncbi:MAG: hypothetical protein HW412_1896, partial [Bacteroidetes bacterium]|nr:hypothetical protein [Bacteroidota bacterium]